MGQRQKTQLPYFKKVQHLKEKSLDKNVFAKVIRAAATIIIHLGEKHFGVIGT